MTLSDLKEKGILILGFGKEGIDSFKFLRKLFPEKILGIGDRLKIERLSEEAQELIYSENRSCNTGKKIKLYLGKNYLKFLKNYEVIIKSPGISPRTIKPFITRVRQSRAKGEDETLVSSPTKNQKVTSPTEIFFENCPGKIIGITGTKGKSTTSALIYRILKEGGVKAHLVGNIGKPVLQLLFSAKPNDVYIYELSSHQLCNLRKSPQVAVFLNIYPEHLDYYENFNEYLWAKQNITRYQTNQDYLIFNPRDKNVRETLRISGAKKIPINPKNIRKIIKIKNIPLLGEFNLKNVAAAIEVAKLFRVPPKKIKKAIKTFKPLAHRLEFIETYHGIKFYNDSLSTIPETTMAAIDALGSKVQTLILGGFDRGLNFTNLARKIIKSEVETVILFPTTGERIWKEIEKEVQKLKTELPLPSSHLWERGGRRGRSPLCPMEAKVKKRTKSSLTIKKIPRHFFVNNMADAVILSYSHTEKGRVCLLSCASPSFGIFRDYKEKGGLFKKYVKKFSKNEKSLGN